jgi:hypothetical protein
MMDKEKVALTDRSGILPNSLAVGASGEELTEIGWKLALIKEMIEQGMTADGAHHKQHYLARLAEIFHFDISHIEDHGMMP